MRIFLSILFCYISLAINAQTCISINVPSIGNIDQSLDECNFINPNASTCLSLKAQYPIFKRTDNYKVDSIPFNGESPYVDFNVGTALNPNADDEFFAKIDLPFKFCFFNNVFSKLVVGSNGSVSFNTEQLGFESYPNFSDSDLNLNSIFAGMSDLVFSNSNDSNIYYTVVGEAPCRKFIINFYKGRLSNCEESITSQIVLHEGSNEIDIFIKEKPLACFTAIYKKSVIGIKNNNPANPLTIFAPNRNVDEWSTTNEAWKFTPNGSDVKPRVEWLDARRNIIKTGDNFEICPELFSSYAMRLIYNNCDEEMIFVKNFNFISQTLLTDKVKICDINSDGIENNYQLSLLNKILFGNNFRGTIQYFEKESDANTGTNPITLVNVNPNTQIWLKVITGTCISVFGPISFQLNSTPDVIDSLNVNITLCDVNFNGSEGYKFSSLNEQISSDSSLKIRYYKTYDEAVRADVPELSLVYDGQYSIYARVENSSGCFSIVEIKLNVIFTKVEVKSKTVHICFNGTEDKTIDLETLSDGMLIKPLTGIKVQYFDDYYKAFDGTEDLEISKNQTITDDGDTVTKNYWLRFTDESGCYTIRELKVILLHVVSARKIVSVCDKDNDSNETFNLHLYDYLILGNQNGVVQYFNIEGDAQQNINSISSLTMQKSKELWVRIESYGCVGIYPVTFTLTKVPDVTKVVTIDLNEVCDNNNDGVEKLNLKDFQSQIYHSPSLVSYSYYLGYNERSGVLSQEIRTPEQFNAKSENVIYVSVKYDSGCASVVQLNLNLHFLPSIVLKPVVIKKCSFDSSASVEFDLNETIPLAFDQSLNEIEYSHLKIEFYHTKDEANKGESSLALTNLFRGTQTLEIVWARFEDIHTGCYSVAEIHLETYLPPKTTLHTLMVCDNNNDGYFEVDLLAEKERYVLNYQDYFIYSFYTSEQDALKGATENAITNPKDYQLANVQDRVWVRVESIVGCASVVPITFNAGVKLQLQQYGPFIIDDVCDINNDGVEVINLTRFENVILSGSTFEYFESKEDLIQGTSISNPSTYTYNQNEGKQFYVRVSKTGYCPEFISITVSLKQTSMFVIPETFICPFEGSVDVSPIYSGAPITNYEWKNASGQIIGNSPILYNVTAAGEYSLKVIANGGCETYQTFTIKNYDIPEITSLLPSGSSYKVIANGDSSKTIVYSKDKITWQSSDTFSNLPPGVVTFYVKYEDEDCLSFPKQGIMPDIQNVITPNSDGKNDVWKLKNLHVFDNENSTITIFDRYQKSLYQQSSNTELTWDGTYNGRPLSTDSYWYVIKLPDGRVFTGWILLKNRN